MKMVPVKRQLLFTVALLEDRISHEVANLWNVRNNLWNVRNKFQSGGDR